MIQSITQGTGDLIAALENDFRCIFRNDAFKDETRRVWGLDIEIGTNMLQALAPWPEERKKAKLLWRRALNGESFSITMELKPSNLKNRLVYNIHFNPIYDIAGRQIGAVHIMRNITGQVQSQQTLRESQEH